MKNDEYIIDNSYIYWLIKDRHNGEVLGILEESYPGTSPIGDLSKEIGHRHWFWDNISKSEFETYQVFGFKEYVI